MGKPFFDPAFDRLTVEFVEIFLRWSTRLRKVAGPSMDDAAVLGMARTCCEATLAHENERKSADAAILSGASLPPGVVSLAAERAKAAGWGATKSLDGPLRNIINLDEIVSQDRVLRMAEKMNCDTATVAAEAFKAGIQALEAAHGLTPTKDG